MCSIPVDLGDASLSVPQTGASACVRAHVTLSNSSLSFSLISAIFRPAPRSCWRTRLALVVLCVSRVVVSSRQQDEKWGKLGTLVSRCYA